MESERGLNETCKQEEMKRKLKKQSIAYCVCTLMFPSWKFVQRQDDAKKSERQVRGNALRRYRWVWRAVVVEVCV
jgi:hypothetical protein